MKVQSSQFKPGSGKYVILAKATSIISFVLFCIMFSIVIIQWLGTIAGWDGVIRESLGVITATVFILLCPIAPAIGVIGGILGLIFINKTRIELSAPQSLRPYYMISILDIAIGILMVIPLFILFLGCISGQM